MRKQLERTQEYIERRTPRLLDLVLARDDYIDNLKTLIQRKVVSLAARIAEENKANLYVIKAIDVTTLNLERIADFCVNVVNQVDYIENEKILDRVNFDPFFAEVISGMKRVEPALFGRDVQDAIQICRAEETLDSLYINVFRELLAELGHGKDAQSLVTAIFVCTTSSAWGDSLLNIGEAIISACLGEPVKMSQFQALESSLKESELGNPVGGVALQAIPGTRSGHRVARVSQRQDADGSRMVIFKEGRARKLKDEHERIKKWGRDRRGARATRVLLPRARRHGRSPRRIPARAHLRAGTFAGRPQRGRRRAVEHSSYFAARLGENAPGRNR